VISPNRSCSGKSLAKGLTIAASSVMLLGSSRSAAELPQYNTLPIQLAFPLRIDRSASLVQSGWDFQGQVELRRATGAEHSLELETDERAYAVISTKFRCKTALPDCSVAFRWKTHRVSKDVEVAARISAPAGQGVLANAVAASGVPMYSIEKRVKLVPGKEWTSVEIPLGLGKNGMSSLDQTFTLSLIFRTRRIKVTIGELRIVPTPGAGANSGGGAGI
jgi:hypothetical protein